MSAGDYATLKKPSCSLMWMCKLCKEDLTFQKSGKEELKEIKSELITIKETIRNTVTTELQMAIKETISNSIATEIQKMFDRRTTEAEIARAEYPTQKKGLETQQTVTIRPKEGSGRERKERAPAIPTLPEQAQTSSTHDGTNPTNDDNLPLQEAHDDEEKNINDAEDWREVTNRKK